MITVVETERFSSWLLSLEEPKARAIIQARINRLRLGLTGDCRSVGNGVREMRVHYRPAKRYHPGGCTESNVMAKPKVRPYDAARYLESDAEILEYLNAALEDGHPGVVALALGDIARAKGMTSIARECGVGRESLYKSLSSNGNPELATVLKVLRALGIRLRAEPAAS